ncbi:hypothetical protein ACOME3_001887 [Neoechinorhynchus agilis]
MIVSDKTSPLNYLISLLACFLSIVLGRVFVLEHILVSIFYSINKNIFQMNSLTSSGLCVSILLIAALMIASDVVHDHRIRKCFGIMDFLLTWNTTMPSVDPCSAPINVTQGFHLKICKRHFVYIQQTYGYKQGCFDHIVYSISNDPPFIERINQVNVQFYQILQPFSYRLIINQFKVKAAEIRKSIPRYVIRNRKFGCEMMEKDSMPNLFLTKLNEPRRTHYAIM